MTWTAGSVGRRGHIRGTAGSLPSLYPPKRETSSPIRTGRDHLPEAGSPVHGSREVGRTQDTERVRNQSHPPLSLPPWTPGESVHTPPDFQTAAHQDPRHPAIRRRDLPRQQLEVGRRSLGLQYRTLQNAQPPALLTGPTARDSPDLACLSWRPGYLVIERRNLPDSILR